MDGEDLLLESLQAGRSILVFVPPETNLDSAAENIREYYARVHAMNLSIVPMMTETDQKLAIGPGMRIE